ncbi:MAG: hypothetical protein M5U33_12430 [Pseudorhodoplanes sp.]|nr:hypothetical protein [Pseudorhodoplanes sp.]
MHVELAQFAVMHVDDVVRVVDLADAHQLADRRLDRHRAVDIERRRHLAVEHLGKAVMLDDLLGLLEAEPGGDAQADIGAAGPLLDDFLDGAHHFAVREAAHDHEAVLRGQDVDGAVRLDLTHIDASERGLGRLADRGKVVTLDIDRLGDIREQRLHRQRHHAGKIGGAHRRQAGFGGRAVHRLPDIARPCFLEFGDVKHGHAPSAAERG